VADAPTFDLQSHSLHSDGVLSPAEVVATAAGAGVELLALSDHDTVAGVEEALAAAAEHGIAVVPAVELSAVHDSYEDLHVLGYRLDHHEPRLLERLEAFRADREGRAGRMAQALRDLGFTVDESLLEARAAAGKPVGRPHLAAAVIAHPDNAERLAAEGRADVSPFIEAYLIPGTPGYRPRTFPTVEEAIALIQEAGGVAVWAHPFWDLADTADVLATVDRFVRWGLDGVEVFYPTHDREQTLALATKCADEALLMTGSSDFHGPEHRVFSGFRAFHLHGLEPRLGRIAPGSAQTAEDSSDSRRARR
jgi:predicted metal-dependent phosphoesterase TrpH